MNSMTAVPGNRASPESCLYGGDRGLTRDYLFYLHRLIDRAVTPRIEGLAGVVLDVGCGTQPYRSRFTQKAELVACDVSGINADVHASVSRLPFPGESFDGVLMTEVLEHLPDPAEALGEVARVCKLGATLILTAPFSWHLHQLPHDYFRFTSAGLRTLVERAGFEVLEIQALGGGFSASVCKMLEASVADFFVRIAEALHLRRGRYRTAALLCMPINVGLCLVAPALDRLLWRDPFGHLILARKGGAARS